MTTPHPLEKTLGNISVFLEKVFSALKNDGIAVSDYELDHVCYRVETKERYDELKELLKKHGTLLAENMIAGRPIAVYKLNKPFVYKDRKICCIELPSPKQGSKYREGFEHVEFVINMSFEEFIKKHASLEFDTSDSLKEVNPDIKRTYAGFAVKFHQHALEYVVKYL